MNKEQEYKIDKSGWGPGPWQDEPDRVEWRHRGLPCMAIRATLGHWCGYIAVPPGHALYGRDYNDVDADVHGGLTYARKCARHICHVPRKGEPENVYWFGFDCAHYSDLSPGIEARNGLPNFSKDSTYRTLVYVKKQTNKLADQLV